MCRSSPLARRWGLHFATALIAGLLLGGDARGQEAPLWETPFFRFHAPPELAGAADFYREELEEARRRARDHWTAPLNESVDVFLWPRESWESLVHENPAMRDVLAFVRGADQSLVLNHVGIRRAGPEALRRTLTHEYIHIYLGRMIAKWPPGAEPRRLPRWLEEGLAMAVAGEGRWWSTALLDWQGPRRMIPLGRLADEFPTDPALQAQAYRQALSAAAFLAEERGGLTAIIDEIVDPARGPGFVAGAWNPAVVAGFEQRWHETLRIGWRWLLIFTTAGFLWTVVMALAGVAWLRRRQRARRREARWALEAEGLIPAGLDEEEQDEAIRRLLRRE